MCRRMLTRLEVFGVRFAVDLMNDDDRDQTVRLIASSYL